MEIIDESASMLSNYEVFTLLQELKAVSLSKESKRPSKHHQNLATVAYSTLKYLERMPCSLQSEDIIAKFLQALQPFKLTKAEKMQLLNQRPTTAVEIQLIIEESEERLTEEQIDSLLEVISTHLPGPDPPAQPAAEEEMAEMEVEEGPS